MEENDAFRDVFKYYKKKKPAPDLSGVIDFEDESSFQRHGIIQLQPIKCQFMDDRGSNELFQFLGLESLTRWNIFQLESHPGLYFIRNPFNCKGINHWSRQCFESYCRPPNPTNVKDLTNAHFTSQDCHDFILEKLRWATLGYHHNWDTKEYSEKEKGEFPSDLALLSKTIAASLGFDNFIAEAAIVNFYAIDSSIGGHTDHSERNHTAPLLSISFGQSAVFLLGGLRKSVKPSAMLIRNGDVVVMAGESRLCYHGVPKILHNPRLSLHQQQDPSIENSSQWWSILDKMRLNLNIRQVNT